MTLLSSAALHELERHCTTSSQGTQGGCEKLQMQAKGVTGPRARARAGAARSAMPGDVPCP